MMEKEFCMKIKEVNKPRVGNNKINRWYKNSVEVVACEEVKKRRISKK